MPAVRCSSVRAAHREIAGSPARRRGNFLLRGQKKVTKEKALNRIPAPQARATPCNSRTVTAQTRPAALSRLSLSPASSTTPPARLTRGCTPCSPEQPNAASLGRRDPDLPLLPSPQRRGIPGEPGVQPALTGVKVRSLVIVIGTAARAQRVAFGANGKRHLSNVAAAPGRSCAVQRLSFGDFSLARQRKPKASLKVTRPPGRTPGTALAINLKQRAAS